MCQVIDDTLLYFLLQSPFVIICKSNGYSGDMGLILLLFFSLFGMAYDEKRYEEVLKVCQLGVDLDLLKDRGN